MSQKLLKSNFKFKGRADQRLNSITTEPDLMCAFLISRMRGGVDDQ